MLADRQAIQVIAFDLLGRHAARDARCFGTLFGHEPFAVAMHLDPECAIDTLRRPHAIAAQVTARPHVDERLHVRIERRFALGARGHLGVAEKRVHLGAAERQCSRERTLERDGMRVRTDGGRHQHAWTAARGIASGRPERLFRGEHAAPVRISVHARVVPPPRETGRAPERGNPADAVLVHALTGSSINRMNSSGGGSISKRRHGSSGASSSTE